jgi:hypothetical protein
MLVAIPIATVIKITINQVTWSFNNYHVFRQTRSIPDKLPVEQPTSNVANPGE